jgi:hypothetical protein
MLNVDWSFPFPVQEREIIWVTDTGLVWVITPTQYFMCKQYNYLNCFYLIFYIPAIIVVRGHAMLPYFHAHVCIIAILIIK